MIVKNLITFLSNQSILFWANFLIKLKIQKEKTKKKKINVYETAAELYNDFPETYFDGYNELSDAKGKPIELKYDTTNLFLNTYNYNLWFENEELTDREKSVDLSDMPLIEGDKEEIKEGKGLKVLTPKRLLTRPPILLCYIIIKAVNNSYKLKNEIRQIQCLFYQHNKMIKKVYNNVIKVIIIMEENMIVIRGLKSFYFNFG